MITLIEAFLPGDLGGGKDFRHLLPPLVNGFSLIGMKFTAPVGSEGRLFGFIVDDLGRDVPVAAENGDPRAVGGAGNDLARSAMAADPRFSS